MTMDEERRIIGFDRKIGLSWLDATADWAAQGLSAAAIRERLDRLLDGQVAGAGPHRARGKTMTVLLHLWVLVPDVLVPLRDDGIDLLRGRVGRDRLPVHWGMCLATYPFFHDVAATTGRLLSLQGRAALSQIVRRMTETWGTRSTVPRAVQRVVRSFVGWGVLTETGERGIFAPAPKIAVHDGGAGAWLLEAGIAGSARPDYPLHSFAGQASFYPLNLRVSPSDVRRRPRLALHHQALDGPIVTWTAPEPHVNPG